MIYPGDILAVRGAGWLSDGIAKAEYGDNEPTKSATHVGIFVAGSPNPVVIEALSRVKTNPLFVSISGAYHAYALHDSTLNDLQRLKVINKAMTFSADDYGYIDLISQWLDARFKTNWWTDKMAGLLSHFPICSYVVGAAYDEIGLDFGIPSASLRPSDILRFALAHPTTYSVTQLK